MIHIDHIPAMNADAVKTSIWKTTDGGRTWQKWCDAPDQSVKIILLDDPDSMLLATGNGLIFVSNDSGQTWKEERSVRS